MRTKPEHYTRILKIESSSEEMRKSKHSIPVNRVIFSTRKHGYDFENDASFRVNYQNPKPAALIHHPKNNENLNKKYVKNCYKKVSKISAYTLNSKKLLRKLVNFLKVSQAKGSSIKVYSS